MIMWNIRQHGTHVNFADEKCMEEERKRMRHCRAALLRYLTKYSDENDDAFYIYETKNGRFLRLFVKFMPCIASDNYCSPVVSVDACHLKGEYNGQLFGSTCLGGQHEMVVLAFAIFDAENNQNLTGYYATSSFNLPRCLKDIQ